MRVHNVGSGSDLHDSVVVDDEVVKDTENGMLGLREGVGESEIACRLLKSASTAGSSQSCCMDTGGGVGESEVVRRLSKSASMASRGCVGVLVSTSELSLHCRFAWAGVLPASAMRIVSLCLSLVRTASHSPVMLNRR